MVKEKPKKPSLNARILNPLQNIKMAPSSEERLARVLFMWEKGAYAGQLGNVSADLMDSAGPEERLKLAAILLETGRMTAAVQLAAATYRDTPGLLHIARYPALTLALSAMRPELTALLGTEPAVLDQFARQGNVFADKILANPTSIAVVGNSPMLLEHEAGAEIDDHSVVIRFNNYQLSPKWRKSTGFKTTIWAHTKGYDWLGRRDRGKFDVSILPGRAAFYRGRNVQDLLLDHAQRGQLCDFVPHGIYNMLIREHDIGAPSTGLAILSWIHESLGSLETVNLYGFKLIDQPPSGSRQYFDQGHVQDKHPHDWQKEYAALCKLAPAMFQSSVTPAT